MLHFRSIHNAAVWFLENDPGTSITEYCIRQLVKSGTVPSIRVGKKYLVAVEALEEFFQASYSPTDKTISSARQVWQIH